MRCFRNIAQLIRTKRQQHPKGFSQSELSHLLGYKNGQFISNVERALCNVPLKMLGRVADVLDIPAQDLKTAILRDHEETLNNYLKVDTLESSSESSSPSKEHNDVRTLRDASESSSTGAEKYSSAVYKMS